MPSSAAWTRPVPALAADPARPARHWRGAVAAALALLAAPAAAQAPAAPPPPVLVVQATLRDIARQAEFTGRVRAVDLVELRARVGGPLGERRFTDGQEVAEGALLFTIDPAPFEAVVAQRRAAIESAEATLEVAAQRYQRAQELWRTRSIPEATLDQRRGDQLRAAADLAIARAALAADAPTSAEVSALLAKLFEGPGVAAAGGPAALMIRRETARGPLPLPFHVAARQFFGMGAP